MFDAVTAIQEDIAEDRRRFENSDTDSTVDYLSELPVAVDDAVQVDDIPAEILQQIEIENKIENKI